MAQKLVRFFADHPRLLILAVIAYILLPIDLVPEMFLGPIGYVDDLVVVILPLLLREYARKLKDGSGDNPPKDYFDTTAR